MRLANEALIQEVDQARILLRELYHRIRNDMQVLEGQAFLAQRRASDPASKQALQAIGHRVMSLAGLYDHLLARPEQRAVAFDDYLDTLCLRMQDAHDLSGRNIRLEITTEPVRIALEQAAGLGIAVNELIANATEHAFDGENGGTIRITLRPDPEERHRARLTVSDDGRGMDKNATEGDGLTLVRRLMALHGGRLTCRSSARGTSWTIAFPCP
jgi:two-component sensor histidine kinase